MTISWAEIQFGAIIFSKRWEKAHSEEAQGQMFVKDLLYVFGVDDPAVDGGFEFKVQLTHDTTGYIDYLWKKKQIAIEMKSKGKDLEQAYLQLKKYLQNLPEEDIPDIWLVCDFMNMRLYRRSTEQKWTFQTKYLYKYIKRFTAITGYSRENIRDELVAVNVEAAEKNG